MQSVPETLYTETKLLDRGVMPNPRAAYFTLTYKCNQRCYYCFYKDWNNRDIPEDYSRIPGALEQLKEMGVQSIEFEGGGDPLMTPGVENIFERAHEMGFKIGLLTNGMLLKDKIAETFIRVGTYVRISLDTVNPEIYKKVRGVDAFALVSDNIKKAIEIRNRTNSSCQISVKLGMAKEIGEKEISESYKYFDGWGIDNIQVKNLWDKNGKHYRTDMNRDKLTALEPGRETPIVKKVLYPKFMAEPCWISPVQTALDIYGDMYMCVYYMHRKGDLKIGNIYETPMRELWGSEAHKKVINGCKISECLKHDCRFQKYMRAIRKMQEKGYWEFL